MTSTCTIQQRRDSASLIINQILIDAIHMTRRKKIEVLSEIIQSRDESKRPSAGVTKIIAFNLYKTVNPVSGNEERIS